MIKKRYPKKFEKWYSRNFANRGIIDYGNGEEQLKDCCFKSWEIGIVMAKSVYANSNNETEYKDKIRSLIYE